MSQELGSDERRTIADGIGERPETVIAVAALLSGHGRFWFDGDQAAPTAVLIESALVPGEPQAFGDPTSVMELLEQADGWSCVEVESDLADAIRNPFDRRWGIAGTVTDVVHALSEPPAEQGHPLVRPLTELEALEMPEADDDMIPDCGLAAASAAQGRFFAAVEHGTIVGWGGSLAAGDLYADVSVHVAAHMRGQGLATACAALVCNAVRAEELVPVWSTGSDNAASLAVARKLGFDEVARLTYLIRET